MYLEIAEARTIMQAKHNAANKMMNHIKEVAATGKTLNKINHDTLLKCSDWLVGLISYYTHNNWLKLPLNNGGVFKG